MTDDFQLTEREFTRISAAFAPLHLGDEVPPYFRAFLVLKLSSTDPLLAARIDAAPAVCLERLFTQVRERQFVA
jgi:hypothetical protein